MSKEELKKLIDELSEKYREMEDTDQICIDEWDMGCKRIYPPREIMCYCKMDE